MRVVIHRKILHNKNLDVYVISPFRLGEIEASEVIHPASGRSVVELSWDKLKMTLQEPSLGPWTTALWM